MERQCVAQDPTGAPPVNLLERDDERPWMKPES